METIVSEKTTEVQVGQPAPDFAAKDLFGQAVNLSGLTRGRKALLLFYRGGWCPFCNEQLAAIARDYQKFRELDVRIVAVSSEEAEKGRDLLQRLKLPFVVLSDTALEAIDRYGVREVSPSEATKARGISQLSKPSAFIIDGAGIVRYRYVGKNAADRPKNEELLRALGEVDEPVQVSEEAEEGNACRIQGSE